MNINNMEFSSMITVLLLSFTLLYTLAYSLWAILKNEKNEEWRSMSLWVFSKMKKLNNCVQ